MRSQLTDITSVLHQCLEYNIKAITPNYCYGIRGGPSCQDGILSFGKERMYLRGKQGSRIHGIGGRLKYTMKGKSVYTSLTNFAP